MNYEVYDKKMLAIVDSLKEWRHNIEGAKHTFTVYTDHKNLEYFLMTKSLNRRQARWFELLANYDFTIVYGKKASNGKADALSRHSEYRPGVGDGQDKQLIEFFFKPEEYVRNDGFTEMRASLGRSTISVMQLVGKMKVVFEKAFLEEVRLAAPGDPEYVKGLEEVKKGAGKEKGHGLLDEELLYYKGRLYILNVGKLRIRIATNDHDSRIAVHFSYEKSEELISRNFYWLKLHDGIYD